MHWPGKRLNSSVTLDKSLDPFFLGLRVLICKMGMITVSTSFGSAEVIHLNAKTGPGLAHSQHSGNVLSLFTGKSQPRKFI